MKQRSTLFLRAAVIVMGILVIVLCAVALPAIQQDLGKEFPSVAYARYPIMVGVLITAAAILAAFYQVSKVLDYIDQNKSFSLLSVKALQYIKYCAFVIAGVFTIGMPVVYQIAEEDDSPGLILIVGAIFIGAPVMIAVFAGVCQRLFQNAIDIKSENDLTV